jgi:tryptophanyl-tRNA synthetase
MKKILLSGVQPTGAAHIGNYFGAMKQFVDAQTLGHYDCIFMIADYHALNHIQNKKDMNELTYELALDYLAIGINPETSILFKQSDVSAHTELAWIFDTIVTMPYLMRAHAYKDAEAKNKELNVGTFNYPVLMAADILLYNTDVVPVGQDQKQHVEYVRDIALKFNHIFCEGSTSVFKKSPLSLVPTVAKCPKATITLSRYLLREKKLLKLSCLLLQIPVDPKPVVFLPMFTISIAYSKVMLISKDFMIPTKASIRPLKRP